MSCQKVATLRSWGTLAEPRMYIVHVDLLYSRYNLDQERVTKTPGTGLKIFRVFWTLGKYPPDSLYTLMCVQYYSDCVTKVSTLIFYDSNKLRSPDKQIKIF